MLIKGMLLELPAGRGIAKLESVDGDFCDVSVFHSIVRSEPATYQIKLLERAYLSPQTRVYVLDDDRYRVGRVADYLTGNDGMVTYEIRFPNGKVKDFNETDLFLRPWHAPDDPAEILAAGGAESQFLHDRRHAAVTALGALNSAAQGLTSLTSAGVDFVPHQVAAVRRVLSDPVQRYLLADEVGLGKTIEAGLIIRQHLIDNPETKVLVATPTALCGQWRSELLEKLRLDQFGDPFECISHADIARVNSIPDILVVDEAHHLVGNVDGPLSHASKRLREVAAEVPVLLLLSATPPLGNEERFLALLNLLDPQTHPLDDLEGFRVKLEQRRTVGRILLSLNPDTPGLVLRQRGTELERSFPNDPIVQDLAPRLVAATRENSEDLGSLCAALKEHVADSYRIHQRLIRSRRADAQGWEFRPRGPVISNEISLAHAKIEGDPSDLTMNLASTVEDWRSAANDALVDNPEIRSELIVRYRSLLEAVSEGANSLETWVDQTEPLFVGEQVILTSIADQAIEIDDTDRIEMMVESTRRLLKALKNEVKTPRVVAFSSSIHLADAFQEALSNTLNDVMCQRLEEGDDEVVEDFKHVQGCAVLVVDRSAEEGLNLSFADGIIHLDLPLDAARIEQRIGRLDRYGRRQDYIRHRILVPSDEDQSPWLAWFDLIASGLMIFHRSISDVQFLLDEIELEVFEALFISGAEALLPMASLLRQRLDEERKSQDEQYALDRIALAEESVETYIQSLEDAEADEVAIEKACNTWFAGVLQIKKRPHAWPAEDPFKFAVERGTLIPRMPWQQMLDIDDTEPLTWKRRIATRDTSVTLLRPGTPMIDVLSRFTLWDDRGTAFITYRCVPHWDSDPWIGFKLCFTIEPDLKNEDLLTPSVAELAASRRAQRYLPQVSQTLFVDINGDAVSDAGILETLKRPYVNDQTRDDADINLGSRPKLLQQFIDPSTLPSICRQIRDSARITLQAQVEFKAMTASAVALAKGDLDRRKSRLIRRQSAGDAMARADIALIESILPVIAAPRIKLDAIGCFVLAKGRPRNTDYE